ncbi:MAG TPA: hypothetical protein VFD66_14330, partial [Verrucomicrobiae bacterium]|nr:hypothetical protein [Verrucomicrobiae bacterium]
VQGAPRIVKPLIGAVDGAPLRRGDLAEWRRLAATMDSVLLAQGQGPIYVLASSTTINSSDLLSVNRSLGEHYITPGFVRYSAEIDRRDGFPAELLKAKYVMAADPVQLDFDPAEQQIIAAPERELLEGSGIAGAFQKLPYEFVLDGGVKVYIFQKVRNFTDLEIHYLSDELRKAHPDRAYIYLPPQDDKRSM